MGIHRSLRLTAGLVMLGAAAILAGLMWFKNSVLVIDPGKGTPIGLSVRTDTHVATLIQTLEPYTPSLNRNHGNDTYRISLFIVPLDGSTPVQVPLIGGLSANSMGLAKILGRDGRTLWFDVNGIGGVDLNTFTPLPAGRRPEGGSRLQGAQTSPMPWRPDAFLCAGLITGPGTWLGLHSRQELDGAYRPGKFVRRVARQEDARQPRRFHRAVLEAPVDGTYHRIRSMIALNDTEYLNAALLRIDDRSEPLRLTDPDGVLMMYTSAAGLNGTLIVARVDIGGHVLWTTDTGIDRFRLSQILPGRDSFAFVGTRPSVPDKVSEPLLVIVEHAKGGMRTESLWR